MILFTHMSHFVVISSKIFDSDEKLFTILLITIFSYFNNHENIIAKMK